MTNIKNKPYKFSTIFKSCLILSLGASLIGCGGSGASSGGGKKAGAITVETNQALPSEIVKGHEAIAKYTVGTDQKAQLLSALVGADNGGSTETINAITLPDHMVMIKNNCSDAKLTPGETCTFEVGFKDDNAEQTHDNIIIESTDDSGNTTNTKIPAETTVITENQETNKISVVRNDAVLKANHPTQVKVTNNNKDELNNVSVHIPSDIVTEIDVNSIKGGEYNAKTHTIAMDDNLQPGDSNTFEFSLKKGETDEQVIALDQKLHKDHSEVLVDAANAKTTKEPVTASTDKDTLLVATEGLELKYMESKLQDPAFAKSHPNLAKLVSTSNKDDSIYVGNGSGKTPDHKEIVNEILTGENDGVSHKTIYNINNEQYPDAVQHVITSDEEFATQAKATHDGVPGVSEKNVDNISHKDPDAKTAESDDSQVIKKAHEVLTSADPEKSNVTTVVMHAAEVAETKSGHDSKEHQAAEAQTLEKVETLLKDVNLTDTNVVLVTKDAEHSGIINHEAGQKKGKDVDTVQNIGTVASSLIADIGESEPKGIEPTLGDEKSLSHKPFGLNFNQESKALSSPGKITAMNSLPEELANKLSTVAIIDKDTYTFFNDGTYIRFDASTGKLDSPKKVSEGFPGIKDEQAKLISAIVYEANVKRLHIFLKDGTTFSYDFAGKKPDTDRTGKTSEQWHITEQAAKEIAAVIETKDPYHFVLADGNTVEWYQEKGTTKATSDIFPGIGDNAKHIIGGYNDNGSIHLVINKPNDLYKVR